MPVNKGLRDQENERIQNQLKQLIGMPFVPDQINAGLKMLSLDLESISLKDASELIAQLQQANLDWENFELFADFLIRIAKEIPQQKSLLTQKAISIYQFIQNESKVFSFEIFNKIASAQRL